MAENEPIQITADQLISNNEEKYAEFIENVKAIQGDFVITSDKLRIYYQGDPFNNDAKGNDEEMIKKIRQFLEEVRLELRKVSWPTFDELRGSTYVVLSLSLIVAVFLFIVDLILTRVLNIVL